MLIFEEPVVVEKGGEDVVVSPLLTVARVAVGIEEVVDVSKRKIYVSF